MINRSKKTVDAKNPKRSRVALATALQEWGWSRRDFLASVIAAPILLSTLRMTTAATGEIAIKSPNGQVKFLLRPDRSQLSYRITLDNRVAIDTSELGISIDGV